MLWIVRPPLFFKMEVTLKCCLLSLKDNVTKKIHKVKNCIKTLSLLGLFSSELLSRFFLSFSSCPSFRSSTSQSESSKIKICNNFFNPLPPSPVNKKQPPSPRRGRRHTATDFLCTIDSYAWIFSSAYPHCFRSAPICVPQWLNF